MFSDFLRLTDNSSRIKAVFEYSKNKFINISESIGTVQKTINKTKVLSDKADQIFEDSNWLECINVYNNAIKLCPQNNADDKQLYVSLIEKRCIAFLHNNNHKKSLQDIAFIKKYGYYSSIESLNQLETSANNALLLLKSSNEQKAIIKNDQEEQTWQPTNITYPVLTNKVKLLKNDTMGRYFIAIDDIKTGEIVAIEKPYVSYVAKDTNCANCALSTNQIYACEQCKEIYCCEQCLNNAKKYHQYECAIQFNILETKYQINVTPQERLALRMITQRSLEQVIQEHKDASVDRLMDVYNEFDYYNVIRLVNHEDSYNAEELYELVYKATCLVTLLKYSGYFGTLKSFDSLSDEEILIGVLLIKYIQIIKHNSNRIKEMHADLRIDKVGDLLYTTTSLFTHSCDANLKRYNIGTKLVIRSMRPIKPGDILDMSYGTLPTWWKTSKTQRQIFLKNNYNFICECQPCNENWPLYEQLNKNLICIRCECSNIINWNKQSTTLTTTISCTKCSRNIDINSVILCIQNTNSKLDLAKQSIESRHFEDAWNYMIEHIETKYKYFAPPFGDNEELMIQCIEQKGNKHFMYKH